MILAGSLDLSVPYVASLTTLVAGGIMAGDDANMVRGVLTALAVAALVGLASGLIVTLLDVHGFIATLGVGLIISGYLASNYQGSTGQAADDLQFFGVTGLGVMPYVAMFMFAAAAIVWAALRWTRWGHHLYAVGGNRAVARMSGLRTAYPVIVAHVLCARLRGARRPHAALPHRASAARPSAARAATTCSRSRRSCSAAPCSPAARAASSAPSAASRSSPCSTT